MPFALFLFNRKKKISMTWIDYIISQNPQGILRVIYKHGGFAPLNYEEIPAAVEMLIQEQGDEVIEDILKEHPDYNIIVELEAKANQPKPQAKAKKNQICFTRERLMVMIFTAIAIRIIIK